MQKNEYAKQLTKDYLQHLGIVEVSRDGKTIIRKNAKGKLIEVKQSIGNSGHNVITLYDANIRKLTPSEFKTKGTGQIGIAVHRIVYAWFRGIVPDGFIVDHINNDKLDNRLENLQLLTPKENLYKNRDCDYSVIKCKLDRPRSYYEAKLEVYYELYLKAKEDHNAKDAHRFRTNISATRARLRYWDKYHEEV